ncbi:rhomboid family intramembrane serine protease [Undibacterium sp. Ji50W]|uniref:rhomboid family intramembrane serine protease n=1 Tax=Undibacterium sp. Ji50W TaxID=3413041 RepID=UPI003BF35246
MQKLKPYSITSIALIGICVVVALLSHLGESEEFLRILFIADPDHPGLSDVLSGQIWRLITPIFIHFNVMHIIFNMLWVWDLGRRIDREKGARFYIGFVAATAVVSNLAQYVVSQSPFFGGMSGVVYGLFGYMWIRGRFDKSFNSGMRKETVHMMLAWLVLCWTGLLGPIANWAHLAGLLVGVVWAYLETRLIDTTKVAKAPENINLSKKQNLVYLSSADILKIEAQRSWVREHYLPDARHKFDTVAGKLNIIDAILNQKLLAERPQHEQDALEIVFADALVQETGLGWAAIDDGDSRTLVLVTADAPLVIFGLVPAARLLSDNARPDVAGAFATTLESIRKMIQGRATPVP